MAFGRYRKSIEVQGGFGALYGRKDFGLALFAGFGLISGGLAHAGGGGPRQLTRQLDLEVNADATFSNDVRDTGVAGNAVLGWKL